MNKISLVNDIINTEDIESLIEWLKTNPRLTKGELTVKLEEAWAKLVGTKYATFVNSGSSANLLMIQTLLEGNQLSKGDAVIVPALSWATDLFPVMQLGLKPVLCDCNLETLSIDVNHLKQLITTHQTKAVILVSVLGLSPNMDEIVNICKQNNILLLEDVCESLGSEYRNKKLGCFGDMSSFSTYFGHHLSTIEGGMVCTNNKYFDNILKSIRSHGWSRDWEEDYREEQEEKYDIDRFDALFTFYYVGFNTRSTDLQAFIGLRQLNKLGWVTETRTRNFELYQKNLKNDYWKPITVEGSLNSNFAYPVIHPKRHQIVEVLKKNNVEVRPLICGSMEQQPAYIKTYGKRNTCLNASTVHNFGLYLPNHPELTEDQILDICNLVNGVINE